MQEEFVLLKERIKGFLDSFFLSILTQRIDEQILYINNIRDQVKTHLLNLKEPDQEELKFFKEIENYNRRLLSLLEKIIKDKNSGTFGEEFPELNHILNEFLNQTEAVRIGEQEDQRFRISPGDSVTIKVLKIFKIAGYFITVLPVITLNSFRKLFHRQLKSRKKWKRKILFRNLIHLKVKNDLLLKSFEIIKDLFRDFSTSWQGIWEAEEIINKHFITELDFPESNRSLPVEAEVNQLEKKFDSVLNKLRESKQKIKSRITVYVDEIFYQLDEIYLKAGTLEYPSRLYSDNKIEKSDERIGEIYRQLSAGWKNTLFVLFDDWKLNKDIYLNEILEVQELYLLREESKEKIFKKVIPGLEDIKNILLRSKTKLEGLRDNSEIKAILQDEKSNLNKLLGGELINKTAELLLSIRLPETVDELENNLRQNIERTSARRAIVKEDVYNREIRDSEIEYIEPGELIRFEILPEFLRETKKLKSAVIEQLDDTQKKLLNIDQIADFNLESAIASVDSIRNEKQTENNPEFIAADGLQRAVVKTEEINSLLLNVYETIVKSSSLAVNAFNKKILKLTSTDNILEIRLRITKAKAIEKTVKFRVRASQALSNFLPAIIRFIKRVFTGTGSFYKILRRRLGLEKPRTKISTEISDFLTETENAINKLPYVYQRLFRIEPLENEKFYERRDKEIDTIQFAYDNWKKGHYAPAVLTGEKGSGITTTLNFMLKNIVLEEELIRKDIEDTIESGGELLRFMSSLFKNDFHDSGEIIQYLNTGNKKIIILENIQHLFLRRVGGFIILKLFFEIISGTNPNVFWIVSSTTYAWNYLEKVLKISDYFSYVINLSAFSDEQIVDIILKRHRVSGYNILFGPSSQDLQNKTFQKLSDPEKQTFLKEKYFSELNNFAQSNLSISMIFWMRSTIEVKNDNITIGSLEALDFSFLQGLSEEKVFTLFALLIHDGLSIRQHAAVFNQSEEKSRLNLLLLADDGIIIKTRKGYSINPLLYRQTVSMLQTRNILH